MTYCTLRGIRDDASSILLSRRAMLKHAGALGLSWAGVSAGTRGASAAPVVTVAAPAIDRINECLAAFSIVATVQSVTVGARYEVFGDILEWDEDDGSSDVCCAIPAQPFVPMSDVADVLLEGRVLAANLGLAKGIGPASDEALSPDLVELFARVWLRDLETSERFGPWDSPRRVAVALGPRAWQIGRYPGSEFAIASGRGLDRARDPVGMPAPRKCSG